MDLHTFVGNIVTPVEYSCKNNKSPHFKRLLNELSAPSSCSINKGQLSPSARLEADHLGILIVPDLLPNLSTFLGYIRGPPDCPYEHAVFEVAIHISPDYPYKTPDVKFTAKSRPWHPNVSSASGYICCTVLSNWEPTTSLKDIMMGLQFLLQCPNWDSPQDQQVQMQYRRDPKEYERKARMWAKEKALPCNHIEFLMSNVPTSVEEKSHGNGNRSRPKEVPNKAAAAGRESVEKSKLMGSFQMSTKKKNSKKLSNHDGVCSNICPVQ